MRKSLPCSEVLPPASWREASAWSAVAEELCRIPGVDCDCAGRPCEACEVGLRCEEDTEDGRPDPEAELRSDAELASSIWRSFGVDKFFRILLSWEIDGRGNEKHPSIQPAIHSSLPSRGDEMEVFFQQIDNNLNVIHFCWLCAALPLNSSIILPS